MPRGSRILSHIPLTVSLVMLLLILALWLRSFWFVEGVQRAMTAWAGDYWVLHHEHFLSNRGKLVVYWYEYTLEKNEVAEPHVPVDEVEWLSVSVRDVSSHPGGWLGFDLGAGDGTGAIRDKWFTVPHWFLLALAGVVPLRRTATFVMARRRRPQLRCVTCGYDLRATPDRCPECGSPAAPEHT
jgi:hypothetical protein